MEVKLIAMTDAVMPKKENELVGEFCAAEHVCDHAARTCTSAKLEPMLEYDDTYLSWGHDDLRALEASLRSGHESIIEHAVYTFEIKGVSRALTHQLVRHRIASYSQQSQRYVNMDGFEYVIPHSMENHPHFHRDVWEEHMESISEMYRELLDGGIPEEDARYILPNACTTNIIVTMNARELRHFFALRCCERAQWEIRELANKMLEICKEVSPTIFENAGPRCEQLGYCPEAKGCGRMPKKEVDE